MYKRILVPIDGSRTAMQGLKEAMRLAQYYEATVRLMHVVDAFIVAAPQPGGHNIADIRKTLREQGARILADGMALLRKQSIPADSVMEEIIGGRAAEAVVAQARKWRADLIVVGTHGRRGVSRLIMGSDAELVARTSTVPVLLVRAKAPKR